MVEENIGMSTQPDTVPDWFHRYAVENERQHREQTEKIGDAKADLIKWGAGLLILQTGVLLSAIAFFG